MTGTSGLRSMEELARGLDIDDAHFLPYGRDKAKVDRAALAAAGRPPGKLVLVSAITPTSAGEGKTTMSISLAQGLARIGERVAVALREPSLGPTFGSKGGATGGGASTLHPRVDINLHFTGDMHAVGTAHNLLAALLDNHLHHGNRLGIDPRRVLWPRVVDLNDRALREVVIGLGGPLQGVPRETGFDITPASEVMAVLCLAEDEDDLRRRLGRMIVALTPERQPVTAADVGAVGAMMVLLKEAVHPNLVQTCEGVPAFLHGGPFANIAHGCNSVTATRMALAHADWAVTEAGFGFDLGGEKFFDIKCVGAGLDPVAVVLVATVRALKRHGGVGPRELDGHDPAAVERGLGNLERHVESVRLFGRTPIVTLNRFAGDRDDEIGVVRAACARAGVPFAVCDGYATGGAGAVALAETLVAHVAAESPPPFAPLYDRGEPVRDKMRKVARQVYGADDVVWSQEAERRLARVHDLGYDDLPLCVAKTQMSLSDDPKRPGRPEGFVVTVSNVVLAAGAGFVVPLLGAILRMPGLPASPQAERMDLAAGEVTGMV